MKSIFDAVRLIEKNLTRSLNVKTVARVSPYSLFYFQRLFHQTMGISIGDYIRHRRLTEAAIALVETEASAADLARKYQYGSAEAFTRSFKRFFGKAPRHYRRTTKSGDIHGLSAPNGALLRFLERRGSFLSVKIVARSKMTVIGPQLMFEKNTSSLVAKRLWPYFIEHVAVLSDLLRHKSQRVAYGVITATARKQQKPHLYYCAGVETKPDAVPPFGMVKVTLAAQTYAVFRLKDGVRHIRDANTFIRGIWLPHHKIKRAEAPEFERYVFDERGERQDVELWIPIVTRGMRGLSWVEWRKPIQKALLSETVGRVL